MQAWRSIRQLQDASRFGPWLKRKAINVWPQHQRRSDALRGADELIDADSVCSENPGAAMGLDYALGTVKSHIRRGTKLLQERLAAYARRVEEPE